MSYILVVFLLGLVILGHEFGHFVAGKYAGIPIQIFSIGFGPGIFKFKKGNTEYRISLIPVGGYVLPDVEEESEFFKIPAGKRIMMTMGGPLASLLITIVCFSLFSIFSAGFSLQNLILKPIMLTFTLTANFIIMIPSLFKQAGQLSGVIGIVSQGGQFVGLNLLNSLSFMAILSINLFVLNLLPVPVLDGGKMLVYALERIHPKFIKLQFPLAIVGWVLILGLMIYVTVLDIGKFIV
ncbi:MAG: site-2 protease family protein [Clostridia bacterium]|nr:site-2 protease family protein [Clostridia bacterium]